MKVKANWEVKQEGKEPEKREREIEVSPVLPANLAEAVKLHGEKEVLKAVHDKIKSAAKTKVTAMLVKGKKDEEIHKAVAEYKLSSREKKSEVEKAMAVFKSLSEEQKKEILASLGK